MPSYDSIQAKRIELELARRRLSFTEWFKQNKPSHYAFPPHVEYLCSVVDRVVRGELQNVAISLPPGHGKSQTITTRLPVYWGQRNPKDAIVFTGYNQDFADRNLSKPARDVAESLGILDMSSNAMNSWSLTNGARLISRGVGSAPTGINPISLLVCDDPIKDRMQAESETERNNIWDWWTGSIVQRFYPRTKAFVIATRWHHDDLIGRLKKQADDSWTFINIPAIAVEDDPLGRKVGEALWDAKPIDFLESLRRQMGDYNFEALFQGNPSPREGALFKVDKLINNLVEHEIDNRKIVRKVRRWDIASSSGKGDYTVGVLMGILENGQFIILNVKRFQYGTDERNKVMLETARTDGRDVEIIVPEDPGSAGKDQALAFMRMFVGYNIKAVRETGSKTTRADAFASQLNTSNVFCLREPWTSSFVEELRQFPNGVYDDQVDASAGAFNELCNVRDVWSW